MQIAVKVFTSYDLTEKKRTMKKRCIYIYIYNVCDSLETKALNIKVNKLNLLACTGIFTKNETLETNVRNLFNNSSYKYIHGMGPWHLIGTYRACTLNTPNPAVTTN